MARDEAPEDEIDRSPADETEKERLARNRFYNPELDQGDATPHWVSEIEAFLSLAFWLMPVVAAVVLILWASN